MRTKSTSITASKSSNCEAVMSAAIAETPLGAGPAEFTGKLLRYRHLLPPISADLLARMNGAADDTASVREPLVADAAPDDPVWPAQGPDEALDRAIGCLLGLAIGDAIGSSVEGLARGTFLPVEGPTGGGPLGLATGEWTGATAMGLCLADCLAANATVDLEDFAIRLNAMLTEGENTSRGSCIGIDTATRAAIECRAAEPDTASASAPGSPPISPPGSDHDEIPGHDSLLRLAPLAIMGARDRDTAEMLAVRQSRLTHPKAQSLDCCRLFVAQLTDALNGADKESATRPRVMALCPEVLFVSAGEWRDKPRDAIGSAGHAVHTLEAALWSVWRTDNFRDAVLTAAELGGAAGGIAAVCGQLAGALYGASSIPEEWLEKLAWWEKLEVMAADLHEATLAAG
jgi:ADP-ribosylglycohydrolase